MTKNKKTLKNQSGFTLIELMVVIVILAILATFILPNVLDRPGQARITKAKNDVKALETAIELYRLDNFSYPDSLEDLATKPGNADNWRGYLKSLPKDPWNRDYIYSNPGEHGAYDLFSLGADGVDGGEGEDATIGNWE